MTAEELTQLEATLNRGKQLLKDLAHLNGLRGMHNAGILRVFSSHHTNSEIGALESEYLASRLAAIVAHEKSLIEAELTALTIPKPVVVIATEAEKLSAEQIQTLAN